MTDFADYTVLGGVSLPPDLQWVDEFGDGSDLVGQVEQVTVTGALVVQVNAQQAGRRITLQGRLEGRVGFAAITRAQLDAVRALAAVAGATYTLTFSDGRAFTVLFRRGDGPAVEAAPLKVIEGADAGDLYFPTIRLMQV
jgi:hypothetical protein